jgi:hypothetical protein
MRRRSAIFSETERFKGERAELRIIAARYALRRFPNFHELAHLHNTGDGQLKINKLNRK